MGRTVGLTLSNALNDEELMGLALAEAKVGAGDGEVPVGAVIVDPAGDVVASNHNRREELSDPTAHAEILVIREAARSVDDWRLLGHTLYVTLEPCPMCAGAAAVAARLARIVYGASDPRAGAAWSLYNIPQDARLNHCCEITQGVRADEATELLTAFFESKRQG